MLAGLRGSGDNTQDPGAVFSPDSSDLLTPASMGTILELSMPQAAVRSAVAMCTLVSCFSVATGWLGEARGTTMVDVKSAVDEA